MRYNNSPHHSSERYTSFKVWIVILLGVVFAGPLMAQPLSKMALQRQAREAQAFRQKPHPVYSAQKGHTNTTAASSLVVHPADSISNPLHTIIQSLVGNGVTISNVQTNLPQTSDAYGSFTSGTAGVGIGQGLLMTSGSVFNAVGPNISTSTSQDNGLPGYLPMDTLGYDATIIDFDLVSTTNLMTWKYVFASEEYNEWVGSQYNDQFSFFISGPGYPEPTNIALIPATTTPVAINNVNLGLNALHYINNDTLNGLIPNPGRFNELEYDGLTKVLTTTSLNLVPGQTYHIKLVVQDVGDHVWDSGVFIEGGSITSDLCVMELFPEVTAISDTGNGMDGKIEVYVSGANGVPHAVWSNGVAEELEITNLGPGTYNVVVTDDAGCVATLAAPIVLGGGGPVDTCIAPATPGAIDGPSKVCRNSTAISYSVDPVPGATSYEWSLPAGTSGSSSTNVILLNVGSTFTSGDLEVKAFNACGESTPAALTIQYNSATAKPATPGVISGIAAGVCESATLKYDVATVANANSYIWTVPAGVLIIDGQGTKKIEVAFAPGFVSGLLKVQATNCLGTSAARSLSLTRVTAVPASISGPSKGVCAGSTQTYSCPEVAGAGFYNWTVPAGATITDGAGTNSIDVLFPEPFTSGKISVTSGTDCYTSAARSITVLSVPSVPASLSGPNLGVCAGTTQAYTCPLSTTGATGYVWTAPSGSVITGQGTNAVSITFPAVFTSGNVTVAATNGCGQSAAKTLLVRSVPAAPASISGLATGVCGGSVQVYSCPVSTTGATGYNWTVPSGATLTDGQGTNSISVTLPDGFVSGNVTVAAVNGCGQSTVKSLAIRSVPAQPGVISGQAGNLCGGGIFTYTIATVTGATSYNWTVPAGCTLDVNGGTGITLSVPSNFVSGTLSVSAVNACGNGTLRTLSLNRLPSLPGVISGPALVCPGSTGLVFTTPQVGTLTYNWTTPAGASITQGQGTNQVTATWGSTAGNVTVKAVNACGISAARSLAVALNACRQAQAEGNEEVTLLPAAIVYPNPGSGVFHLQLPDLATPVHVEVYNLTGIRILEKDMNTQELNTVDLSDYQPGMYLLRLHTNGVDQEIKIMKQ